MAGDGGVAGLAGQRRLRVVGRAPLELVDAGALDEVEVPHADRRDAELAHRLADGRRGDGAARSDGVGSGRLGGGGRRRSVVAVVVPCDHAAVGERLVELVLQLVLGAGGLQVRAPQLVGDEQQQHHAGGDQQPPDRSEDTARGDASGRGRRGFPGARRRGRLGGRSHAGQGSGRRPRSGVTSPGPGWGRRRLAGTIGRSHGARRPPPWRRVADRAVPRPRRRRPRRGPGRGGAPPGPERRRQDHHPALLRRAGPGQRRRGPGARRRPHRATGARCAAGSGCSATPPGSTTS